MRVIDMHTVKPIDREAIARAAAETGAIVVAEEHLVDGGLGVRVAQVVAETQPCPMEFVGIQETYAESGQPEELLEKYGLVREERGGRGPQSGRRARSKSAPLLHIDGRRLTRRRVPGTEPGVSLDRRPGGVFQRIYGDPSPIFGEARARAAGPDSARRSDPRVAATWKDRFARALEGRDCCALRERHGGATWNISVFPIRVGRRDSLRRRDWRARSRPGAPPSRNCGTPCSARSRPWSSSASRLRDSCTIPWDRT